MKTTGDAQTWGEKQDLALEKLKSQLLAVPSLKLFDPTQKVRIVSDASRNSLGSILFNYCPDKDRFFPVAFVSSVKTIRTKRAHYCLRIVNHPVWIPRIPTIHKRPQRYRSVY